MNTARIPRAEMLAMILTSPSGSNRQAAAYSASAATQGDLRRVIVFASACGMSPSRAMANSRRLMLSSEISAVLAVANMAVTANVRASHGAMARPAVVSGESLCASCRGSTTDSTAHTTSRYSSEVMTTLQSSARGTSRRASLASSDRLATSSKPM